MTTLNIGPFQFIPSDPKGRIDIYFIERSYGDYAPGSYMDVDEAEKLVDMILQQFPTIGSLTNERKP